MPSFQRVGTRPVYRRDSKNRARGWANTLDRDARSFGVMPSFPGAVLALRDRSFFSMSDAVNEISAREWVAGIP